MLLFISDFFQAIKDDFPALSTWYVIICVLWFMVFLGIVIDLISGVRKAKTAGIARTSYGFRSTVSKIIQYYSVMAFAGMFDVISSLLTNLPYFSMIAAAFLLFIEAKSVYEKADAKVKRKTTENIDTLLMLLENKDDLVRGLGQALKESEKKSSENLANKK